MLVTTHEELMKLHGVSCQCTIKGRRIQDAKISVAKQVEETGETYNNVACICHNDINLSGLIAPNRLGYKYSWCISRDSILKHYEHNNHNCYDIIVYTKRVYIGELK